VVESRRNKYLAALVQRDGRKAVPFLLAEKKSFFRETFFPPPAFKMAV
jgi:hypothetical protein